MSDPKILYEGNDYFVVDKPAGVVVHRSETSRGGEFLIDAFLDKIDENVGESFRPGIVHRLDKDTSGLLIIAKTQRGYEYFVSQFKRRAVKKKYLALVKGILEHKEGIIDSPIGRDVRNRKRMGVVAERMGKNAVSRFKVLKELEVDKKASVSLVEIEIETGRTHQIRVHMAAIGHGVVGDNTYGIGSFNRKFKEKFGLERQFLHACELGFKDPDTKKKILVTSELPEDLGSVMKKIV
jgi:23S rRNA pseudouridine1911/1915/1917 synthase